MTAEPGRALQMVCSDTLGPQPGNPRAGRNLRADYFLCFFLTPPSHVCRLICRLEPLVWRKFTAVLLNFMQNFVQVLVQLFKL